MKPPLDALVIRIHPPAEKSRIHRSKWSFLEDHDSTEILNPNLQIAAHAVVQACSHAISITSYSATFLPCMLKRLVLNFPALSPVNFETADALRIHVVRDL